jgi:hypothetical protein
MRLMFGAVTEVSRFVRVKRHPGEEVHVPRAGFLVCRPIYSTRIIQGKTVLR